MMTEIETEDNNIFEMITFDNGTSIHYKDAINILQKKYNDCINFSNSHMSLDDFSALNRDEQIKLNTAYRNIRFIGRICEMLANDLNEGKGDHEAVPEYLYDLLYINFDTSSNIDQLLIMSQRQVNFAPDLF